MQYIICLIFTFGTVWTGVSIIHLSNGYVSGHMTPYSETSFTSELRLDAALMPSVSGSTSGNRLQTLILDSFSASLLAVSWGGRHLLAALKDLCNRNGFEDGGCVCVCGGGSGCFLFD